MKYFIMLIIFIILISMSYSKDFIYVCENGHEYSTTTQYTIKVIKDEYNTNNCNYIYNKTKKNKSITLMTTVSNLFIISKLPFLTHITLIADTKPKKPLTLKYLKRLDNIKFLNLSFYDLLDYNEIKDLPPLKKLILFSPENFTNNIDFNELVLFKNLKGLEFLTFSGYSTETIHNIKYLKNLKQLFLADNKIVDLTGIENLKNLYQLDLKNNPLEDYFKKINYQGDYLLLEKGSISTLQNLINTTKYTDK